MMDKAVFSYSVDVSDGAPNHGLEADVGGLGHHVHHVGPETPGGTDPWQAELLVAHLLHLAVRVVAAASDATNGNSGWEKRIPEHGGLHSTEVVYLLLTQQPRV